MSTRYAVASGDWSDAANVWSDSDGGAPGNFVPADGDTFVISAGVSVKMDVDQSAWTGLAGTNIIRGGATPGMLYWANGDDGHLKLQTGATLQGTLDTNRGRLLANSDGDWDTDTALQYSNKAVIDLQGTAQIQATNLDCKLICAEPTKTYVRTYGEDYGPTDQATNVNTTTGVIDWGEAPPAAGTAVRLLSSGTLPTGFSENEIYYVRAVSGNTCKLALQNGDAQIVIPSATGSGNLTMYSGYSSGSATVKVVDDVTADNWTAGDRVVLCDVAPADYDQQRTTVDTINAGTLVLGEAVDSAQYPFALVVLSSRNVSIRSAGTSSGQAVVLFVNGDTHGGTFGEITNTAGSGTTFYGRGVQYGGNVEIAVITGCGDGIIHGSGCTATTIAGCTYGIDYGSGCTATTITGCGYGIIYGSGHTVTTITGCTYGIYYGSGCTATTIAGCGYGIDYGSGCTATTIAGCGYGIDYGSGHTVTTITGCTYGIRSGSHRLQATIFSENTYDLRQVGPLIGYGCSLRSATQNYEYLLNYKDDVGQFIYDPVDGSDVLQKGRILGWTSGGYCTSEEASVPADPPIALDWCHKYTFESADHPVWVDVMAIRLKAGQAVMIPVYIKCSQTPSGMSEHPRVQIIDPNEPWDSAASKLDDDQIADTTDWQTVNVTYTADYDKEVWLRVRGANASGTMYWWADPDIMPGGFVQASSGRIGVQEC